MEPHKKKSTVWQRNNCERDLKLPNGPSLLLTLTAYLVLDRALVWGKPRACSARLRAPIAGFREKGILDKINRLRKGVARTFRKYQSTLSNLAVLRPRSCQFARQRTALLDRRALTWETDRCTDSEACKIRFVPCLPVHTPLNLGLSAVIHLESLLVPLLSG